MVLIKLDMTIPESCTRCPFYIGMNYGKCIIDESNYCSHCQDMNGYEYSRPEWCPLVEES